MRSSVTSGTLQSSGQGLGANAPPPPSSSNPYSCSLCGRSYSRLDHLSRHVRSHTKEKPFVCSICSKAFTRADLLKRHEANHDVDLSNKRLKSSHPPRPRIAKACINCSESKLRCEGTLPCPRCQQKNLSCQYRESLAREETPPFQNAFKETAFGNRVNIVSTVSDEYVFRGDDSQDFPPRRDMPVDTLNVSQINNHDSFQLQTPLQILENGQVARIISPDNAYAFNNAASAEDTTSSDPFGDPPGLANFLRDIIDPDVSTNDVNFSMPASWDLLDFSVDKWHDMPVDVLQMPPVPAVRFDDTTRADSRSGYATPTVKNGVTLSEHAWKTSLWHFKPASHDHGGADQANLLIPMNNLVEQTAVSEPLCSPLNQVTRDRILGTVLSTYESSTIDQVVSNFPSAELLTNLMHKWLEFHRAQASHWLHIASFDPREESPEFLLNMIAAGATLSNVPQINKLSLALLEAARNANANLFERDNRTIRCLRPIQGSSIQLEATLWSGQRRPMEIAESFSQPLITMLRRGGRLQHSTFLTSIPDIHDDAAEIENIWHSWIEHESFKRLVFAVFERDVQTSMSLWNPPLISCSELSLELPISLDLWNARTPEEWRQIYISRSPLLNQVPSFRQCLESSLSALPTGVIDQDFSLLVWLYGHWTLAWSYRQWTSVSRHSLDAAPKAKGLILNSLQQETIRHLERYQIETLELEGMNCATELMYQRLLMNMHSSLEDLQLLAGKCGQEEAKKAYSFLSSWAQSREARQAVFHAGQLLRAAKSFPVGMLQHANAVACYHAGLVLWAFSVVSREVTGGSSKSNMNRSQEYVLIDSGSDPNLQRFLVLGKGTPAICPYSAESTQPQQSVSVFDTRSAMRVVVHLLRAKNLYREDEAPPLIDNLSKLLRGLGRAASSM